MSLNHDLYSLDSLFIAQLEELYGSEKSIARTLPKMMNAAHTVALKQIFEAHLAQTLQHVQRLEEVFRRLHRTPRGEACKAVKELLSESERLIPAHGNPVVRDAALIAAAQQLEHYEMASYGTARTFAFELAQPEIADLLQRTLQEEIAADKKLTQVAEAEVNVRAAQ